MVQWVNGWLGGPRAGSPIEWVGCLVLVEWVLGVDSFPYTVESLNRRTEQSRDQFSIQIYQPAGRLVGFPHEFRIRESSRTNVYAVEV